MARGETGSEGRRKSEREGGRRRGRGTENVHYEISSLLSREIERGQRVVLRQRTSREGVGNHGRIQLFPSMTLSLVQIFQTLAPAVHKYLSSSHSSTQMEWRKHTSKRILQLTERICFRGYKLERAMIWMCKSPTGSCV